MRRQSLIYGIALAALPALPRLHSYHTALPTFIPHIHLPTTLHSYCPPRHTYITLRVVACYILTLWSHIYINSTTRISHIIGVCQISLTCYIHTLQSHSHTFSYIPLDIIYFKSDVHGWVVLFLHLYPHIIYSL